MVELVFKCDILKKRKSTVYGVPQGGILGPQ